MTNTPSAERAVAYFALPTTYTTPGYPEGVYPSIDLLTWAIQESARRRVQGPAATRAVVKALNDAGYSIHQIAELSMSVDGDDEYSISYSSVRRLLQGEG